MGCPNTWRSSCHWFWGQGSYLERVAGRVVGCGQGRPRSPDLGLSWRSLSHFMEATESAGGLGEQLLGPIPSPPQRCFLPPGSSRKGGKCRRPNPTQPPAPDSSAAGRVDQCPALGPSLPICKMRGSDDISASSETPRWALTPLGLHAYLKACALAQHLGQDMRPLAHSSCVISS